MSLLNAPFLLLLLFAAAASIAASVAASVSAREDLSSCQTGEGQGPRHSSASSTIQT
jgi:hypothetical protein